MAPELCHTLVLVCNNCDTRQTHRDFQSLNLSQEGVETSRKDDLRSPSNPV